MRMRIASLLFLLAVSGCGEDDFTPPEGLVLAAECTALGMEDVVAISNGLFDLLDVLDSPGAPLPANVDYDPQTGRYTVRIDLDSSGSTDMTVDGAVTVRGGDLSDGIDPGDRFDTSWTVGSGPTTGSGTFTFRMINATDLSMTGGGSVQSDLSCSLAISDTNLLWTTDSNEGPTGAVNVSSDAGGGESISGTIRLDGSDWATVRGTWRGQPVAFRIDLETFEVRF
ncbi:MAG: hypothetical protein ACYSUN_08435 [Planctomycetota bacterium]|jgi:hypothetical protein